ncbi:hypothetical protein COV13_02935 [Candidatus Woesearchaeota archaeon CG10_big_fil_rev_8_21_14_0_10_32_9]|nr:MAG: hypothetical protein COV13_02935 [Candidatus Woesearchaeota archaeon CG10_big_fil_rev_8_21_14_0_10_32_9]
MAKLISRDTPLGEITLRKYEKPQGMTRRDLVRKLCLSLGLLQPGDSRDVVVDVFQVLLENASSKEAISSQDIESLTIANREKHGLPKLGIAPSNIRRQVLRLRDLFLVEKIGNAYRINEHASLSEIFNEKIERYYLESILSRVREYISEIDLVFLKNKQSELNNESADKLNEERN